MKRIKQIVLLAILASGFSHAQVLINKTTLGAQHESVILDFGPGSTLVLPWVTPVPSSLVEGSLIYHVADKKVMYYDQTGTWVDLSVNSGVSVTQDGKETGEGVKIVVGGTVSGAQGVLELEASDRALVLPKVSSYADVKNPVAGTICYDTTAKMFCVYNGNEWTFWK